MGVFLMIFFYNNKFYKSFLIHLLMKRGLGICFLIILLAMPLVLAISTEVKIKTMPYREVQVGASKISGESLQFFSNQSDQYGDISFILDFADLKYNLFVFIKEEGTTVATKREYNLVTGEPVYLEVATPGFEFIDTLAPESKTSSSDSSTNETINNTTSANETETVAEENDNTGNITENLNETLIESEEKESKISSVAGAAVTKIKENKKILIYVFIGIILITGIFMFLHKRKGKGSEEKEERHIRVTKLSDKIAEESKRQAILDMEGKLRQLQNEFDKLRS